MTILPLISYTSFATSVALAFFILKSIKNNPAFQINLAVCLCFTVYTLAQTFFYIAPSKEIAWSLHRLGMVGWMAFITLTLQYVMVMHEKYIKYFRFKYRFFVNLPTALMIIWMWVGSASPAAETLYKSPSAQVWCYSNSFSNLFFWVFVIYLLVYLGTWFYFVGETAKKKDDSIVYQESEILVLFDLLILGLCFGLDFLLPLLHVALPPLASIPIFFFLIRLYILHYKTNFFSIQNIVTSQDILDTIIDPVFLLDLNKKVQRCNSIVYRWFSIDEKEIIGKSLSDVLGQDLFANTESQHGELIYHKGINKTYDLSYSISYVKHRKYGNLAIVVTLKDITEKKQIEEQLRISNEKYKKLALYDALTGLPNRRYFFQEIEHYVYDYQTSGTDFFVLMMDLNLFKSVNDTYGHKVGDALLREIGKRLSSCIDSNCFLARMGGDEFAIIVKTHVGQEEILSRISSIQQLFKDKIIVKECVCMVSFSIGYSLYSDTKNIEELLHEADTFMYREKKRTNTNDADDYENTSS